MGKKKKKKKKKMMTRMGFWSCQEEEDNFARTGQEPT
jgi:hypothetical protein